MFYNVVDVMNGYDAGCSVLSCWNVKCYGAQGCWCMTKIIGIPEVMTIGNKGE